MKRSNPFDINPLNEIKLFKTRSKVLLPQLMPYLAHIIPAKNSRGLYSATSVFELLAKNEAYEVNGVNFTGEQLLDYYRAFYHFSTSEYIDTQTRFPQFCSAVPIPLAAYKQQYGIKYSSWDKTDPLLPRFFGPQMQWLFKLDEIEIPQLTLDEVKEFRDQVLLERKTNTIKSVTSYKFESSGEPIFDKLPKPLRMMLLQTWIFHPSIRHPNMITDPLNWDVLAEPWDIVEAISSPVATANTQVKKGELEFDW